MNTHLTPLLYLISSSLNPTASNLEVMYPSTHSLFRSTSINRNITIFVPTNTRSMKRPLMHTNAPSHRHPPSPKPQAPKAIPYRVRITHVPILAYRPSNQRRMPHAQCNAMQRNACLKAHQPVQPHRPSNRKNKEANRLFHLNQCKTRAFTAEPI